MDLRCSNQRIRLEQMEQGAWNKTSFGVIHKVFHTAGADSSARTGIRTGIAQIELVSQRETERTAQDRAGRGRTTWPRNNKAPAGFPRQGRGAHQLMRGGLLGPARRNLIEQCCDQNRSRVRCQECVEVRQDGVGSRRFLGLARARAVRLGGSPDNVTHAL